MKTIKLDHNLAGLVQSGEKTSTWRLFDDKNLSVNDEVRFIDKEDAQRPETWKVIGTGRIQKVIEKRLGDITDEDYDGHESHDSHEHMIETYRGYYGPDVSDSTAVKIIHFSFTPGNGEQYKPEATVATNKVKLFCDGGSRGNPGPSASGFVIIDPVTDKVIVDKGEYLGVTTNNQAEYHALKAGLEEAKRMGAREVDVYLDSLLVVNQMNGQFKVSNRDLWPVHDAIKTTAKSFEKVSFQHIPREQNKLADAAVNRALDEHLDKQVG